MSNQIRDLDRLADIYRFCELILEERGRLDWETFESSTEKWAFVKWLENIGEAAYQLSDETINEFGEVDWQVIINARHYYVHHYFDLDWPRVWQTIVKTDFDELKVAISKIVETLKARL